MSFGLNDNTVKRIAAVAYHRPSGSAMGNISDIYHKLTTPDQINEIANAHTTDAMQHKFPHKDAENSFKSHLAKSAAINRGTMQVNPTETGSEAV